MPRGGLLGHMRLLEREPLEFLVRARREHGDVVRLRLLAWRGYLLAHPDHVKRVLQDRHTFYDKNTFDFRLLKPVLGNGLLTSDGQTWLRQRRMMQPAFHRQRLAAVASVVTAEADAMCARWTLAVRGGSRLDVAAEMNRLTLDVVTRALFGTDVDADAARVGAAVGTISRVFMEGLASGRALLPLVTGRPPRRARAALGLLDAVVQEIIGARRRAGVEGDDLLGMLLAARDESGGGGLSDRELRDQVLTLFVAGHETTSNALAWTWYLLARHPEATAELRAEVAATLGGRPATTDDLPHLRYTRMVLDEAMRLYPPAWATSRNPVEDDEIGGFRIPAGSLVFLSPYVTHRHPEFWERPEEFDPERFRPERAASRPRFAYFPFGGGPHQCIGESFALTEAVLVIATVVQRFRLELEPGTTVVPSPRVTLRPRDGLPMTVRALT